MFDDHVQSQGAGTVPPNLPIGEPEDIFSVVDPSDTGSVVSPAIDDTPTSAPVAPPAPATALSAGVLTPKKDTAPLPPVLPTERASNMTDVPASRSASSPAEMPPVAAAPPPVVPSPSTPPSSPAPPHTQTHTLVTDAPEMYAIKEPKASKSIITAIIIIVVLLILGGGGFFLYSQFIMTPSETEFDTTDQVPTVIDGGQDDTMVLDDEAGTPIENGTLEENELLFGEPIDTDADGLDDAREQTLGTDPAHWDTDGDELSDGDEVIIWKTDPLNPDTDGDTYTDGAEIKNGYSPTGPGKIFEPPVLESQSDTATTTDTDSQ